jgi:hypothetical protein
LMTLGASGQDRKEGLELSEALEFAVIVSFLFW